MKVLKDLDMLLNLEMLLNLKKNFLPPLVNFCKCQLQSIIKQNFLLSKAILKKIKL